MKKFVLFLLTILTIQASAQVLEKTVTYDFTKPKQLTPAVTPNQENGGVVQIAGKAFTNGPVTISFAQGARPDGAGIHTYIEEGSASYSLRIMQTATMTVSVSGSNRLQSIELVGYTGDVKVKAGQAGTYKNQVWDAGTSSVSSVVFDNNTAASAITQVVVKYLEPAAPLLLSNSSPVSGATVESFHSMNIQFNQSVSQVGSPTFKLEGPEINGGVSMSSTVSGGNVTLTADKTYTKDGNYTVTLPAGSFITTDGAVNDEIQVTFSVFAKRNTIKYLSAEPKEGTVNEIPQIIVLSFEGDSPKALATTSATVKKNGEPFGNATMSVLESDTKKIQLSINGLKESIKTPGTWTIEIPAKAIHNTFYNENDEYDRWNDAFTLTYELVSETVSVIKTANELLAKTGLGYPTADSEGRKALVAEIAKADASVESINAAIDKFLNETAVTLPIADQWYKVAGINSDGVKYYLALDENETKATLGKSAQSAAAFKVESVNGSVIVLKTKGGKYLHVLAQANYDKTSSSNLTEAKSNVNNLTLAKFKASDVEGVDASALFGKFTLYGLLGKYNGEGDDVSAYAQLSYSGSGEIITAPNLSLAYSSAKSSAFVFEEASEPSDKAKVKPQISLDPQDLATAGGNLVLTVHNVESATIAAASKPYFTKGEGVKVSFNGTILSAINGEKYRFKVNTQGLAAETYLLNIPAGTFTYKVKEGEEIEDVALSANFTILKGGETIDDQTVTPTVQLSATALTKAGDDLKLTVQNVDKATLAANARPSFTKDGLAVTFTGTILTAVNGSNIQFAVNTTGLTAGTYTLNLPAGTFVYTKEGKTVKDVAMSIQFTIGSGGGGTVTPSTDFNASYDAFSVFQLFLSDRGDYIHDVDLNELIIFSYKYLYSGIVPDKTKKVKVVKYYGNIEVASGHFEPYTLTAADIAKTNPKYELKREDIQAIKLVLDKKITAESIERGQYSYVIEEGTFGDANFGKYLANPSSVKASECIVNRKIATISFQVDNNLADLMRPTSATYAKAQEVLKKTGLGYPKAGSATRTKLAAYVDSREGSDADFEKAIAAFYADSDVDKPASNKYYKVYAQTLDGSKVYLNYNGKTIGLTKTAAEATGFKVTADGGSYRFATGDGKYLRQLSAGLNLSGEYTAANNAISVNKLSVKDVAAENTFGLFSLQIEKSYSLVNAKDMKFDAGTAELTTFNADRTCAFMFEEVAKENVVAPKITPVLTPAAGTVNELKDITITFNGIDKVILSDRSLIKLTDDKKNVLTPSVSSSSDLYNVYVLSFKDVKPDQTYTLTIGEGAFTFNFAERTVKIAAINATYTVKETRASETQLAEARKLLALTGMGYPTEESPARKALQDIVDKGGTLAAYNTALDNYYKDENVMKPGSNRWYKISAVSSDNKEAYLQYDGSSVSLTMDAKAATAFKTDIIPGGKYNFVTGDGKYLQLPVAGSTNLTSKLDEKVNNLAVNKLPVDKTLGLLGIYGALADGKSDYGVVDMSKTAFATAAGTGAKYTTTLTGAFRFVEVQSTDIPAPKVAISLSPADKAEMDVLEKVTVTFTGIDKVKKEEVKLISVKGESDGKTYAAADVTAVSDNVFDITFAGLPLGQNYTLTIGTGAFAFDFAERSVIIDGAKATYTVHEAHATAEQIAAAKKLLEYKGLGYPVSTSKARAALQKIVDSGTAAYVTPYTEAVNGFYSDSDVEKPENGKYYRVAAVASDGKEAYLAYDGETLTITTEAAKATGVKVVKHEAEGTFSLMTADGKYVNVLKETSAAEVSKQAISRLNVKGIAAENTFGLFSLQGKGGFALVDLAAAKIEAPSATSDTFDAAKTNAFRFMLIDKNTIPVPSVTYSITPADKAEVDALETVTIAFEGKVDVEVIQNAPKTIVLADAEGKTYEPKAVTKTKANVYALTFENIAVGHNYGLAIAKGTFLYHFADREFPIDAISVSYSVKEPPASEAQIKEARELLQLTGTGYPSATSKARVTLQSLVDKGGDRAQFNKAMEAYRNDMEVEMPASGKYYTVAAVSNDGKQLYLKADGKAIGLTDDKSAATAFKATVNKNGTLTFSTVDGQYLNPLTPKSIAEGLSDAYTAGTNDFTLRRLQLDSYTLAETLGYFSIQDSEGTYAKVDMAEGYIMSSARSGLEFFDAYETNAFRLTETEEPTGIRCIRISGDDAPVFDLQGRRVSELKQGQVYIKAGKKFVAK